MVILNELTNFHWSPNSQESEMKKSIRTKWSNRRRTKRITLSLYFKSIKRKTLHFISRNRDRLYSKLHESAPVKLCKERKKMIKSAKHCRYDLATTFDIYLDFLLKLANSLNQYVEQEFVIFDHSCINLEFPFSDSDDLDHLHCDNDDEDNEDEDDELSNLHSSSKSIDESTYDENIHVHYGSKTYSMVVSPKHDYELHNNRVNHKNKDATIVSPSSLSRTPPSRTSPQAYPFSMNYEAPNYHHRVEDETKIREREGIPDLEDESELSSIMSSNGTSKRDSFSTIEEIIISNLKPKLTIQEYKPLVTSCVSTPTSSSIMSLKEAMVDIKNEFQNLCDCGREFSPVFEGEKIQYYSPSTKLKAFASCALARIFSSISSCSQSSYMAYQPTPKTKKLSKAKIQRDQDQTKFGDLSSTLEKLYVWEQKLYDEVLGEEKLRISYDKKNKKLKKFDMKGSESNEIDDIFDSIKILHSKINVAVTSISVISREIHELTNDKLLHELNKLIDGLIKLWKIMSTCHQKQFQAISKAKSHVHILDPSKKEKSNSKATLKLEKMILKWSKCFCNFFNKQKALVKHLNDWLQKCTLEEKEEYEDEISPTFGVCNNWHDAINKVSDIEVSRAINNFASNLHQLYKKLKEEKALKAKVRYLLKDYKQSLRSYCKRNIIDSQHYYSFMKMKASEDFEDDEIPLLMVSDSNLANSRLKLIEEKNKRQQIMKHVNDVASSCFQEGLTAIFEALWRFSLENVKVYEQLRVSKSRL